MLFLHTTGTREEASSIVSVVVGVPFVEMLKKPALEVTRLSDVDEFAEGFELVDTALRGRIRLDMSVRCTRPILRYWHARGYEAWD